MLIIKRHTEHQSPVNNLKDIFFLHFPRVGLPITFFTYHEFLHYLFHPSCFDVVFFSNKVMVYYL